MIKRVYIEITNRCNLSCSFCPPSTKEAGLMSIDQFTHIIKSIHTHTKHIYLHVQGEPLTHPLLLQFCDIAYQYQLKVHIVTNGTLLYNLSDAFLKHPSLAQLSISLHAWEEFDEVKFNQHLKQLLELKESILQSNASVFLRIWNQKSEKMNLILNRLLPDLDSSLIQSIGKKRLRYTDNLTIDLDDQFEWPSLNSAHVSNIGRCHAGTKMLAILNDGSVTPCCLDPQAHLKIGNIYESSLDQILSSKRLISLTNGFKQNTLVEDLCQHCSYRTRFK